MRRRHGCDPGGLDRLQPLCARAGRAAVGTGAVPDADQRVPATAVARGALLPRDAVVRLEVLDPEKRPVSAVADFTEVRDVRSVEIEEDTGVSFTLLFDPEHDLEERVLKEQFLS